MKNTLKIIFAILCSTLILSADENKSAKDTATYVSKAFSDGKWGDVFDHFSEDMKRHAIMNLWDSMIHLAEKHPNEVDKIILKHYQKNKVKKVVQTQPGLSFTEREDVIYKHIIDRKKFFSKCMDLQTRGRKKVKHVDYSEANVEIIDKKAILNLNGEKTYFIKQNGIWKITSAYNEQAIKEPEPVAPIKIKPIK